MSIWFTSDPHFGHAKIAELRGFKSVQEHDYTVAASFRRAAKGELWIVGDISSGKREEEDAALDLISGIGKEYGITMHLIPGNHDSISAIHRNAHKQTDRWMRVFQSIQQYARRKIGGEQVNVCHFPYVGDSGGKPDRYLDYRMPDTGRWMIHGHTHQQSMRGAIHPRQISVGWDSWRRPVEVNELNHIINTAKKAELSNELVNRHVTV